MNNDARSKLRSMGGIMASSPELMQVAQKFDNGGPVMGMPSVAGQAPFPPRPMGGPMSLNRAMGSPSRPMMPPLAGTIPVVPREMLGDARRRALAGTTPSFGMGVGLGSLDPILEDDVDVDTLLEASQGRGTSVGKPEALETPSSDIISRQNELRKKRGLPPLSAEQKREFIKSAEAAPLAQDVVRADEIDTELDKIEKRKVGGVFSSSADAATAEKLEAEKNQLARAAGETLSAEDTLMEQPLVPKKLDQSVIDKMLDLAKKDPNVPFGTETPAPDGDQTPTADGDTPTGDQAPPKQTKRDLRSRYNEKLELFKEIYGTDDKDEARDRAMSLAMIGLAIAAGQSPNALTNIAQGAMVGLQGMGAQREAERERERGLKTLALQTAIDQQQAETEAETEAAKTALEQANRLELEEFKARVGAMYGGAGGSRDARNIIDFAQNTYNEALKAASAQTAPDFNPEEETPHQYAMRQSRAAAQGIGQMFPGYGGQMPSGDGATTPASPQAPEIPTITTKAEYDALPSGARFMQNGQLRDKP
jgi:hypothetical protein